jgi:hypothetical protein
MKQVVFIHGGEAFSRYENFIHFLKTREVSREDFFEEKGKRWKNTLREKLGGVFEVAMPAMPNHKNAKYDEWKIWFEKLLPFLSGGAILVGGSLGGNFLLKYLSENVFPVRIQSIFLIAPAFDSGGLIGEDGGDFFFDIARLSNVEKQCDKIFIYYSKDDPVVPFSHAERYKAALPSAELIVFENRGHFLQDEFPELIEHIKQVS